MSDYEKPIRAKKTQISLDSSDKYQYIRETDEYMAITAPLYRPRSAASPQCAKRWLTLPEDSAMRKEYPLLRGCLRYFPAALAGVAKISKLGNDKHNPGEELHHARGKSMDHGDCIVRHLIDLQDLLSWANGSGREAELTTQGAKRGLTLGREAGLTKAQEDILIEASQLAWRALALSQELHEQFGAPLAPGAKV